MLYVAFSKNSIDVTLYLYVFITGAIGIPVVILCLEGGPGTIKQMAEAIKKGTPAVVIDGSGRAADVVCFAYKHLI